MDRAEFIKRQTWVADLKLSLTAGEENARERFLQLAIDTYDYLISRGAGFVQMSDPSPDSAMNGLHNFGLARDGPISFDTIRNSETWCRRIELSRELIERWKSWNREYVDIRARNPRLELRDMMQDISESDSASSWPHGYERHIQAWVDAGDASAPPPFDASPDILRPEFFDRLRELRQVCGGWLYWNDNLNRVVFASEPEWQQVRAAQEAAAARQRK